MMIRVICRKRVRAAAACAAALYSLGLYAGELTWLDPVHALTIDGPTQPTVKTNFVFINRTTHPITITEVKPACGCTTAALAKKTYQPGEAGTLGVVLNFGSHLGLMERYLDVRTAGLGAKETPDRLTLRVNIRSYVTAEPSAQYWAVGDYPEEKTIECTAGTEHGFTLSGFKANHDDFVVRIEESVPGKRYLIHLRPKSTAAVAGAMITLNANIAGVGCRSVDVFAIVKRMRVTHLPPPAGVPPPLPPAKPAAQIVPAAQRPPAAGPFFMFSADHPKDAGVFEVLESYFRPNDYISVGVAKADPALAAQIDVAHRYRLITALPALDGAIHEDAAVLILYDIEHWADTPAGEQKSPAVSITAAAAKVRAAPRRFGVAPDGRFIGVQPEACGADATAGIVSAVDWSQVEFVDVQAQRVLSDACAAKLGVAEYVAFVKTLAAAVRARHPGIVVVAQFSFRFTPPEKMIAAIRALIGTVDGFYLAYPDASPIPAKYCTAGNLHAVLEAIRPVP